MHKALLVLPMVLLCILLLKECGKRETINTIESLKEDSTWFYKDLYGKEHARSENLKLQRIFLEKDINYLSEELSVKRKQIEGFKKFSGKGEISIKVDSIYRDNYITIEKRTNDTLYVQFKDTFQIVDYWKRTWFLGKKKYYVDVKNSNPYFKIESVTSREVKIKSPNILIGPAIQYSPISGRVTPGISIIFYKFSLRI
jgi:hypothetical protein